MHGEFDEELEPVRRRADTELTLSSTTLLGIFFGMVLLCALFFGLGFAVGRFGPGDSAGAGQQAGSGGPSPALAASSKPKPSAAPQDTVQAERSAASPAAYAAPDQDSSANAQQTAAAGGQPAVKPALPTQASIGTTLNVGQQTAANGPSMVQIAAVSHQEDADVLVGALRKRGYAVSVRRVPADNLIHVQVGPFPNRSDAKVMRQKLLNDGYNAIVQP